MKLIIRELVKEDMPHINLWRNTPKIIKSLASPFRYINREIDDLWYNNYISSRANNIRLVVVNDEDGKPLGAVYLVGIDWIVRSGEFAIWIGEESYQGKGIGNFATEHMLSHAFKDLGLNRVHLTALITNKKAINLYKKFGFKTEGILRESAYKDGKFCDMVKMSLLSSEYKNSGTT